MYLCVCPSCVLLPEEDTKGARSPELELQVAAPPDMSVAVQDGIFWKGNALNSRATPQDL